MRAVKKTYGHRFKKDLPANGGKPKVCPKCDLWFSARPRQRLCDRCRPNRVKARCAATRSTRTPGRPRKCAFAQVRVGRKTDGGALCMELAREKAAQVDGVRRPEVDHDEEMLAAIRQRCIAEGLQAG